MASCESKVDLKKVDEIIKTYGAKKSYLIAMLQKVQEEFRYLPIEALTYIGTQVEDVSPATVYGVATFYAQFSLQPKGKYEIKVCDGTACHVRGSMPVLNAIKQYIKLQDGSFTSEDGMFSVETVSCLGACGLAPVLTVNEEVYGRLTVDDVDGILEKYGFSK